MVDKLKQKEKNINKKLDTRKLRLVNRTLREISQIHDSRFLRLFEMTRWTLYFPTFAAFISSQFTAIVKSYMAWEKLTNNPGSKHRTVDPPVADNRPLPNGEERMI